MRISVVGPARPDDVWQRYVHLDAWPGWSPQIRRVDPAGSDLEAGLAGVVQAGPADQRFVMVTWVAPSPGTTSLTE